MTDALHLGSLTVHRLVEMEAATRPAGEFLPNLSPELLDANRSLLRPSALDAKDRPIPCFQSFVVRVLLIALSLPIKRPGQALGRGISV